MLGTIRLLFDYTRWADARMFDSVSRLTPDLWTRDLGSSLKSTRDTVVHIVSAQWIWVSRWKGETPKGMWSPSEFPTPQSIQDRWTALAAGIASFVAAQNDETLARPLAYRNLKGDSFSYPLGQLMLHFVNHSTYHRGQVTTLLRQLGAQPTSTDLVVYFGDRAKQS